MRSTTGSSRTRAGVVAGTVLALIGGGLAIAYWTTSGTGTGTATAGTDTPVTVTQTGTTAGLVPGGAAQPISFDVNSTAPGQVVNGVAIAVTGTSDPGCTADDFTVTQPTIAAATALSVGATSFAAVDTEASIAMINRPVNQDACKGATVNLSFTVS
jgi:hypothetical protein